MINPLIASLTATARSAGFVAQQTAAQTARRLAAIVIVALVAAAALIGALGLFAAALHRAVADASGPIVADLVIAVSLLVVAGVTVALLANLGRLRRGPPHAARQLWHRPPPPPSAAAAPHQQLTPPPTMNDLFTGVDRSWILGAVAAAFVVGLGLGRRR